MPIRATVANRETLGISGLNPDIPERRMRVWLGDIAEAIHLRIAKDFENERGAGKALGRVTDAHEQRKAIDGADPRRGHMFGDLQDALDQGGFDSISAITRGRVSIKFDENKLINRVDHAEWYAKAKVSGKRLLIVLPVDARAAEKFLKAREAEWLAGTATRSRRGTGRAATAVAARRAGRRGARALLRGIRRLVG